ncbi:MAG: hypothetical protein Q9193_002459 [Seirophora villosa]
MSSLTNVTQVATSAGERETVQDHFIPRGPVVAELQFYAPPADGSKPFNYPDGTPIPQNLPKRNFGDADLPVTIKDIRGRESSFTLDDNAFTTVEAATGSSSVHDDTDFTSEASIKANYYPAVERLLRDHLPAAQRIHLFDHTVRLIGGDRPPVLRVHIDQTPKAALGRVRAALPDEADELLKGRVRIINVWRPLNGPVQCTPLAFADSRTVRDEALVAVEHRYPNRTGETISVRHMDEQWYYWSGMRNEEMILLECFDSEKGGRVPHSAFVDPRSPAAGKQRESIEVRALVFG